MAITTDYLVVGAGATGMAFTDTLVAQTDADVVVVDRQPAPGGHWLHAYPFVALHSPSAFYGVDSRRLGSDQVDTAGPNAGFYERASKPEILDYYATVAQDLQDGGRVRLLLGHDYLGADGGAARVHDLGSGSVVEVAVRRAVVDARYLESSVPATHRPSFALAADARFAPIGALPDLIGTTTEFVILGAGKTAVDGCLWLLENGTDPDRIRWVRPQDAWFHDRASFQPLDQVVGIIEGIAADAEAAASASDVEDLVARLEDAGRLQRLDRAQPTTMYRGGMLSAYELEQVRRVTGVVRLGRVRRVERDRLVLDAGETSLDAEAVVVDCTAQGLNPAPPVPVFTPGRIVLQQVRHNSPPFNAALTAFVEAHRRDDTEKNALCPPNPYPVSVRDLPRMYARTWRTEGHWLGEPDLAAWVSGTRLNLLQALPAHQHEPRAQAAITRFLSHVGPAVGRLAEISADRA